MSAPSEYQGLLVSADSHVIESPQLWAERLPVALRDRAPRFPVAAGNFQDKPGGWDPQARLGEMLQDGVSAEVLYPTLALNLFSLEDAALQEACVRTYNDWLIEYCSAAPQRLVGIAAIAAYDTAIAVAELERAKRGELRGAVIWQSPPAHLPLYSKHYDPLWDAAQSLEMPVSLHILTGFDWSRRVSTEVLTGVMLSREEKEKRGEYGFRGVVNYKLTSAMNGLHDVIMSGVFERFPRLKIVLVENEIGWIPFALDQYDKYFSRPAMRKQFGLSHMPSEVFQRSCYATFFNDRPGTRMLSWWGADSCMWSNDFPHPNSTWPNSRQVVQRDLGVMDAATREKLTWRTCCELYGIPRPAGVPAAL